MSLTDLRQEMSEIREALRSTPAPADNAEPRDHVVFIFSRLLGVMLSGWYWVFALAVVLVAWAVGL